MQFQIVIHMLSIAQFLFGQLEDAILVQTTHAQQKEDAHRVSAHILMRVALHRVLLLSYPRQYFQESAAIASVPEKAINVQFAKSNFASGQIDC